MRKFLRPVLIGLSGFGLGMACLFSYFKFSPESAQSLLGREGHHSSRPIVPALKLTPNREEEEEAQSTAPGPATAAPGAPGKGIPPSALFDQDDADFFGGQDPFVAARKLHEQIEKEMKAGFGGVAMDAGGEQITAKEDDKSLRYEIKGVEGSSLNTSVKDGYLTIIGESKRESAGMSFQSTFQRSFPLPPNVDPTKMETISEKDMVVLRFPKKHG